MGGHQGLRHQRPGQPASTSRRSRPTAVRTPTRWPRARSGSDAVRLRVVVLAQRRRSPTASRRTTRSASSRSRSATPRTAVARRHAGAVPRRRQPGRQLLARRPAAATTSPPTRSKDIAAGACMGDGILMDISDREHPVVTEQVRDTENFAFWHSATFNNAGTKVVFTDELGGGGAADLQPDDRARQGRQRHLRHRRRGQAASSRATSRSRGPVQHRELRGPQRLADPGRGQGHHGPGLVPGRHLGLGLHRLRATRRRSPGSTGARSPPTGSSSAARGRRTTTTATSTPTTSRRASTCCRIDNESAGGRRAPPLRRVQPAEPAQLQRLTSDDTDRLRSRCGGAGACVACGPGHPRRLAP